MGAYIGGDARRTEFETFYQLGFGLDVQGDKWEISTNAYLPIGLRRREVANDIYDSGTVLSNLAFSGNNLTFSRFRERTISRLYETAMTGFDLEGGYQLVSWETGNIFAYGGAYILDAPGVSSVVGVRGRVQAEVNNFQAGVSLQSDGNFGTNLAFNFGMIFGGNSRRKRQETPVESILARLGRGVRRQEIIAVDRENEVTTTIDRADNVVAINPATNQAWRFLHVTGGASGSCSTESPCGQITEAMNLAQIGGNDIVYVDAGTNPGLNGFTILDNVQVLSTGIAQFIDVQLDTTLGGAETQSIQLPGSGTGTLPLINGTMVTTGGLTGMIGMGNNSTLSGFDIQTTGNNNNGVIASNTGGFTIDQNQITTTGDTARGIYIYGNSGTISSATISGNTISTAGNTDAAGIYTHLRGANAAISEITVSGNSIATTGDTRSKGVYIRSRDNSSIGTVTISGNTISTAGDTNVFGIQVNAGTSSVTSVIISNNTVSTTGNQATGIYVRAQNANGTIGSATISGNTVTTTGNYGNGISLTASGPNATITSGTISGNLISTAGNYADSIFIQTLGGNSTITSATVTDNTIGQAGAHSVVIQARNASETICIAQFTGNTSSMPNVFGGGGNDLNFNPSAGTPGTINFVGFGDVSLNNMGFDDIFTTNGTVTPVTSC